MDVLTKSYVASKSPLVIQRKILRRTTIVQLAAVLKTDVTQAHISQHHPFGRFLCPGPSTAEVSRGSLTSLLFISLIARLNLFYTQLAWSPEVLDALSFQNSSASNCNYFVIVLLAFTFCFFIKIFEINFPWLNFV